MYAVVLFDQSKDVEVVPVLWLSDGANCDQRCMCAWPPYRNAVRIVKAVREIEKPSDTWVSYAARILHTYERYDAACKNSELAQYTSELNTESEQEVDNEISKKRKKTISCRISNDPDSDGCNDSLLPSTLGLAKKSAAVGKTPSSISITNSLPVPPQPIEKTLPSTVSVTNSLPVPSHPNEGTACSAVNRRIITLLEELKQMAQTSIVLQQQLLINRSNQLNDGSIEDDFGLPLSTMQQLLKIEADCKDHDLRAKLTRYLGQSGGTTVAESARCIMKRLLTNGLAIECNWKGKGGKYSIARTLLRQIICDAVRRNPSTCRAVDTDVDEAVKQWLRFAKDRDGGRQRRAARQAAAATARQ